jgi:hypothetical protein
MVFKLLPSGMRRSVVGQMVTDVSEETHAFFVEVEHGITCSK